MSGLLTLAGFVLAFIVVGLLVIAGQSADTRDPDYAVGRMLYPGDGHRHARQP